MPDISIGSTWWCKLRFNVHAYAGQNLRFYHQNEDFNLILDDAHVLVASKLREMYEGDTAKGRVTAVLAAERVGCGLERVLLGLALWIPGLQ